jgi:hypothetical protein
MVDSECVFDEPKRESGSFHSFREVAEAFFPNSRECLICGNLFDKDKLIQCFVCDEYFCPDCYGKHEHKEK